MTTRDFKLYGIHNVPNSTGTVTINDATILSGVFGGNSDVSTSTLVNDSLTFDDSVDALMSVSITVDSGEIQVGLFEWNYTWTPSRNLTSEQVSALVDANTTLGEIATIVQSVTETPLTSEELAIFEPSTMSSVLFHTISPNETALGLHNLVFDHGAYPYQRYSDSWGIFDNSEATWNRLLTELQGTLSTEILNAIDRAYRTRLNPLLNGASLADAYSNKFITVSAGSTLTWEASVFSSARFLLI